MMPWHHEFFRGRRSPSESKRTSANFRLWVGLIGYCAVNLLCWGVAWGSYRAAIFVFMASCFALPPAAAVALLVFKLKSQKETFTWGAYAAAVVTLAVASWVNFTVIQAIVGAV